eukprot:CAMPEP_0198108350 /NCGR_PEP_ID=MMETSP1442-20131203/377_1 /TAXON_ID= /ORGANISM="Craspedostauros australis, Strain CCMP3328" /LENGTH=46 /DNA_ID= /DNA_START= /DNA_END= /DNA_ORIENTATION=
MSVSRSVISGVSSDGATAGGSGAVGAAVFGWLAAAACGWPGAVDAG